MKHDFLLKNWNMKHTYFSFLSGAWRYWAIIFFFEAHHFGKPGSVELFALPKVWPCFSNNNNHIFKGTYLPIKDKKNSIIFKVEECQVFSQNSTFKAVIELERGPAEATVPLWFFKKENYRVVCYISLVYIFNSCELYKIFKHFFFCREYLNT